MPGMLSEACLSSCSERFDRYTPWLPRAWLVAGLGIAIGGGGLAVAEPVPQFQRGLPVQVQPSFLEPGLPAFEFARGAQESVGGTSSAGDTSSGDLGGTGRNRLLANEWGEEAIAAAEQLGIYGSALGSTCVLEGCQNVHGPGNGTISGWFQMSDGTFQEAIAAAIQENPSLSNQIVGGLAGKNDPLTQSIAAARYLKQGAVSLQAKGISNPTVLDTRSYYQFGPKYAAPVAMADDSQNLRSLLSGFSDDTFRANGITPSTTVGDWRRTITNKIGSSAYQTVLL